jgi:hypothetical protein
MSTTATQIIAVMERALQRAAEVLTSLGVPPRPCCTVCRCQGARRGIGAC